MPSRKQSTSFPHEDAYRLFQALLWEHDQRTGTSALHTAISNGQLAFAAALMDRCQILKIGCEFATDQESLYTPLHWAVYKRQLSSILLLLRTFKIKRPMALLRNEETNESTKTTAAALDAEGHTPAALLGQLQRTELEACRRHVLYEPQMIQEARQFRSSSFDSLHECWEEQQHHLPSQEEEDVMTHQSRYGCEVLTFGRAHHCALGTDSSVDGRPQRVQYFAQDAVQGHGGAVGIAGAPHHTVVVTASGHLYAFGLGKGGRLGTGNEAPCSIPTRVMGALSQRHVIAAAAADNHTLAVCRDGSVFAWGSNRFGQIGCGGDSSPRCSPRRVDDLRGIICVSVAAGEKHSVALSQRGEVFVWGDNTMGQLGISRRNGTHHRVQRVEALWNSKKIAISIAASSQATLVLTKPTGTNLRVNTVFSWGHGSHVPSKVHFDKCNESRNKIVQPIAIACARYHNVVITSDGLVFTWGLHADPLGKRSNSHTTQPSLVTGMLPRNGGGVAVAVAASENHTAVVTDTGDLFTWGATFGKNILGHEGVNWQPDPKRVPDVCRAVAVAAAKEHTILLMGASFPPIQPVTGFNSLEMLASRKIAEHIDLFNVLPVLTVAERIHDEFLRDYCMKFIERNLDGVVNVCQKRVAYQYLSEGLESCRIKRDRDGPFHPLLIEAVTGSVIGKDSLRYDSICPTESWLEFCQKTLNENANASRIVTNYENLKYAKAGTQRLALQNVKEQTSSASDRCLELVNNMDLSTKTTAEGIMNSLSREARLIKKRLGQIAKLEMKANILTEEEREKISRKLQLESDLQAVEPAMETVRVTLERMMMIEQQEEEEKLEKQCKQKPQKTIEQEVPAKTSTSFRCEICQVSCSDAINYELHLNGRKHRNKIAQKAENEEKETAEAVMKQSLLEKIRDPTATARNDLPQTMPPDSWNSTKMKSLPKFKLPPPPHPVPNTITPSKPSRSLREIMAEEELAAKKPPSGGKKNTSKTPSIPVQTPWASAPVVQVQPPRSITMSSSATPYSLGDFITPTISKPIVSPKALTWVSPKPLVKNEPLSFREIQQQEKELKANEVQTFGSPGKWFVQRRDRAGSFREIEEAEAKEKEHRKLVEEQLEIERQIKEELLRAQQTQSMGKRRSKRASTKGKKNQK